jgi:hypothetical protein
VEHRENTELSASIPPSAPQQSAVAPISAISTTPGEPETPDQAVNGHGDSETGQNPWAEPLRAMYQQVVEEPLPDFLADLIKRLDEEGS